jgi:hypothetical protein
MPYLVMAGECRVVGSAPDGDSVRFYPDDPTEWDAVRGRYRVRRNAAGGAQLRLDGIDALETHYSPAEAGGVTHQPLGLARSSAGALLDALGFDRVERAGDETVTTTEPATVRAYLYTRGADEHGRCVAFLGAGEPPASSGAQLFVHAEHVRATLNHGQLAAGAAYPTYYRGLFADLRSVLTEAVARARPALGLWPEDRTATGLAVHGISGLERDAVILPKLFRRLVAYLRLGDGDPSLAGFPAFLAAQDDRLFLVPEGHWTGLDTVVEVAGSTVRLLRAPEELVFAEK